MINIAIDESGSMTTQYASGNGYFVIALVIVKDDNKKTLKRYFRKFIHLNTEELKGFDKDSKMFINNKFHELKGNLLTPDFKKRFIEYMTYNQLFNVIFIKVDNKRIYDDSLYKNTARAFNYLISLCLESNLKNGRLPKDDYFLQIDQRNTKTEAIRALEEHLSINLEIMMKLTKSVKVEYFESYNNILVQIADSMANMYFSYLHSRKRYSSVINELRRNNTIIQEFNFPL